MMALCLQHGFQQQQCEDTLSSPPSLEVTGMPPNGTTSSACWAPSHPIKQPDKNSGHTEQSFLSE